MQILPHQRNKCKKTKRPDQGTKENNTVKEAKEVKEATLARDKSKEDKQDPDTRQAVFLEMENLMMQKMEKMLNLQMESFINMVRPQN